jgi:hypothetical protein
VNSVRFLDEPVDTRRRFVVLMEIDAYEAINLQEALKVIPDTGDWHGQIRYKLKQVLDNPQVANRMGAPNCTAEQYRERIVAGDRPHEWPGYESVAAMETR